MGFCLCFVGLGRVLWVFVIVVMLFLNFFFFTYPSYHEKRKRKKKGKSSKLQNLLCFLGFVLILKIPIRAEGLCVT